MENLLFAGAITVFTLYRYVSHNAGDMNTEELISTNK